MTIPLRKPIALPEFLAWEEGQELRWEFDGMEPVAMTGGSYAHETIGGALRALLRENLRGKPCRVSGPTLKIEAMGRIRYPDAFIHCGPVQATRRVITDPLVVFEVVRPNDLPHRPDRQAARISGDPVDYALCHPRHRSPSAAPRQEVAPPS